MILALLLAAVLGGVLGDVIGTFLPEGAAKTVFSKAIEVGFDTIHLDVYAVAVSFGLKLKINFVSVLTVILVVVYFKWWYL